MREDDRAILEFVVRKGLGEIIRLRDHLSRRVLCTYNLRDGYSVIDAGYCLDAVERRDGVPKALLKRM